MRASSSTVVRNAVLWAVVVAGSWWVVGLPEFSGWASFAVLLAGGLAVGMGMRERVVVRQDLARGVLVWAVLGALFALWQLQAFVQGPRGDHPTLSSLTGALLDSEPERAVGFVAWVVLARELARR